MLHKERRKLLQPAPAKLIVLISLLYADAVFTCVSAVATSFTSGTTGIS